MIKHLNKFYVITDNSRLNIEPCILGQIDLANLKNLRALFHNHLNFEVWLARWPLHYIDDYVLLSAFWTEHRR